MNIRLKINLKETKRTTVNIKKKKNKGLFSEKINKIDKFLVESTRKKKD